MKQLTWYQKAIGYQIYPKTFFDANNDGIGDILGITKKLDYLKELGIDFVWICPFFDSPMDDNGYDVRDYYKINPAFGTMQQVRELIQQCKQRDIKVIIDLVLNHTSDEHAWFQDVKNNPNSTYRDYYIIKQGTKHKPPNNWKSFFGGSAWELLEDDLYYLKIFSKKMPDLNWNNKELRKEIYKIASWWLKQGVSGFRMDAIAHIAKDLSFSDYQEGDKEWSKFSNLDKVHTYLKEFHQEVLDPYQAFAIGEVGGGAISEDVLKYSGYSSKELNVTFTFDHVFCNNIEQAANLEELKTDVETLKTTLEYWQTSLFGKGDLPLFLNNHDFNRVVSNYGDIRYHEASAKCLAMMMYCLWGTPFIYQGEEIGMTNYPFSVMDEFEDVQAINQYKHTKEDEKDAFFQKLVLSSRDNVRTTFQWNDSHLGGFTKNPSAIAKTNPNYTIINAKQQSENQPSIFSFYKQLLALKKSDSVLISGSVVFEELNREHCISYLRIFENKTYLIVCNLTSESFSISIPHQFQTCLLSNQEVDPDCFPTKLKAYDAFLFEIESIL